MSQRTLQGLLILNLIATSLLAFFFWNNRNIIPNDQVIHARGLVIVDSMGVERVILGSPLPKPTFHGYRSDRGGEREGGISGIMLYDSEGQERSGYVTDDYYGNVFFTLDSKMGQKALFIAEPQGATNLLIWGEDGNQVQLGASADTAQLVIDN